MSKLISLFTADINKDHFYNFRYDAVDRAMLIVLWVHAVTVSLAVLLVFYFAPALTEPGPLSWRPLGAIETAWVVALALAAALIPIFLKGRLSNHYFYRTIITLALFTYSYLLVFASGGSIEAHFHFFVIFLLLILYYDWRLAWIGLVAVALHHGILNYVQPEWVYYYGRNDVSVIAHALPVLLVAIFSTWITNEKKARVELTAQKNKELEMQLRRKIPGLSNQ